jgi:DtxR family transcriptional regulator, Mn-dependent transcriptional regulator
MSGEQATQRDGHETTEAAAEYLMMIRYMIGEGQPVIAARLAERLGVSAATVSAMVTRLSREGLVTVDDQTRHLDLSEPGRHAAERTFRRHALAEWLLTEVVGLGWAEADDEAHHLQHAFSDRVTDKIDELLGRPPTCPHGNPIPRNGHTPDRPVGIRLSEAAAGTEVTILRVTEEAEEDARLLTFLQEHGMRPGNLFAVEEVADHLGTMRLRRADDVKGAGKADGAASPSPSITLGLVAAAKLRVLPGRADRGLFHRVPERARLAGGTAAEAQNR